MRCIECGAPLKATSEPIEMELRGEHLTIRNVDHYKCTECGEIVFDSKMNNEYSQAVDREYRKRCGLLSPYEIRAFRERWGLTQEQLQILLGVGKLSVCRWETGRLAQSKTVDYLLRAYMSEPHLVIDALERLELSPTKAQNNPPVRTLSSRSERLVDSPTLSQECAEGAISISGKTPPFVDWISKSATATSDKHKIKPTKEHPGAEVAA